ncbi:diguanylate cyclase domain-containing protein [Alkalibacter saccharofermentans]|uniref:diguanylate cyclase domain-containing protein n=1 Tax=Alkalibacter saccharofermentans TaxID=235931 RepID=UPI0009344433|nr:diguanylate cyclase [Alkalibacter saccharofermentans]
MNILSLLSFGCFVCFLFLIIYSINENKSKILKVYAVLVCGSLGLWAFAYSFFYTAPTKESAWFWHRIGVFGGIAFPVFVFVLFMIQTGNDKKITKIWQWMVLYLIPVGLLIVSLATSNTIVAVDLIQSTSGFGWTYINKPENTLFWAYLLYITSYLGVGLFVLWSWGNKAEYYNQKKQSHAILFSDIIVLLIGGTTDLLMPMINDYFPPIANIGLVVFIYGIWISIKRYNILETSSVAASDVILDTIMDPVILMDREGKIVRCNNSTCALLDYAKNELVGKNVLDLLDENSRRYINAQIKRLLKKKSVSGREFVLIKKDGTKVHTVVSASVAEDKMKGFLGIVATYHDITARKQIEQELLENNRRYKMLADELYNAANFDALTNLPNRRHFFRNAVTFIDDFNEYGTDFGAIYIDLNDFKIINDTYGHNKGDQVLIKAAQRMLGFIGNGDILARIGGDEFIMLLGGVENENQVMDKADKIKKSFGKGIELGNKTYSLGASVGYSIYSRAGSIDDLIKKADSRMYEDKLKECKSYLLREEARKA